MNVPAPLSPRQTSTLAIVSLIFGVLSWIVIPLLGSLVAIITGHMARAEIRREPERLDGDGMALAGLILGYLAIGLWLLAILLFFGFLGSAIMFGVAG